MATYTGTNNPLSNPKQAAEKFRNQLRKMGGTYRAKDGESWYDIAKNVYGDYFQGNHVQISNMAQLLAMRNGDVNALKAGIRLNIPMPGYADNPSISPFILTTGGANAPSTLPPAQANPAAQPAGSSVQYPSEARYTAIANAQRANTVAGAQTLQVPQMPNPPRPVMVTPQARNSIPLVTPQARNPTPYAGIPAEGIQPYRVTTAASNEEGRYTTNPNSQQARMGYNPEQRGRGYGQPARPAQPNRPTWPGQTPEARQRPSVPSVIGTPTAQVAAQVAAEQYPAAINMLDIPAIIPMEQMFGPNWYADTTGKVQLYVDAFMQEHGYKRSEYGFYIRMDGLGSAPGGNPYYTGFRGSSRGYGGGGRGGGGGGSYGGYGGSYGPTPEQLRYANESGLVTWRI